MTTLAGHTLLALRMTVPRAGTWVADVVVDTDTELAGSVALEVGGRTWRGTVASGGVELGRWSGRVVGGAGRLTTPLPATAYADTDLRSVLSETLRDAGEALSTASGDLSAAVPHWARLAAPAAQSVGDVARASGLSWRVVDDGSVWVGADTWEALDLGVVDIIERDPRHGRWTLAGDGAVQASPGRTVTLEGAAVQIGAVEHSLEGDRLRTTITRALDDVPVDRLSAALTGIIERVVRPLFLGRWPSRVVMQHDDGTLDVVTDDPRIVVPRRIRYRSLPGVALVVPADTRCAVVFEAGDPARPVVDLWEPGDVTRLVVAGGEHPAARQGHAVQVTLPMGALIPVGSPGGPLPAAPLTLSGTITEGTDALHLP